MPFTGPVKLIAGMEVFLQTVWSAMVLTEGIGLTLMINDFEEEAQTGPPGKVGVTVMVAIKAVLPGFVTVKEGIFPVPLAARPIAGLSFIQLNVAPAVPVKLTAFVVVPLHRI